jgi:hypothetical protein
MATLGFYMKGKGDGCYEGSTLEWREYQSSNAFLASKVLDLFQKVEHILNAHGMGASSGDPPKSTM